MAIAAGLSLAGQRPGARERHRARRRVDDRTDDHSRCRHHRGSGERARVRHALAEAAPERRMDRTRDNSPGARGVAAQATGRQAHGHQPSVAILLPGQIPIRRSERSTTVTFARVVLAAAVIWGIPFLLLHFLLDQTGPQYASPSTYVPSKKERAAGTENNERWVKGQRAPSPKVPRVCRFSTPNLQRSTFKMPGRSWNRSIGRWELNALK